MTDTAAYPIGLAELLARPDAAALIDNAPGEWLDWWALQHKAFNTTLCCTHRWTSKENDMSKKLRSEEIEQRIEALKSGRDDLVGKLIAAAKAAGYEGDEAGSDWLIDMLENPKALQERDRAVAETDAWKSTASDMARNAEFYYGVLKRTGEMFGVAAMTSDDGSVQDSVLVLKIPELVSAAIARAEAVERRAEDAIRCLAMHESASELRRAATIEDSANAMRPWLEFRDVTADNLYEHARNFHIKRKAWRREILRAAKAKEDGDE